MTPCLKDENALYPWKKGCWYRRRLHKSDEGWDPNEDLNLKLDFRHDLLDQVQVKILLFSLIGRPVASPQPGCYCD